jgi:transcriptional regulator with XRE-family HTH domain
MKGNIVMIEIKKSIGQKIRKLRKERGMTQADLAENTGLSNTFIAHIEIGDKICSLSSLEKIASALMTNSHSLLHPETNQAQYDVTKDKLIMYIMDRTEKEKETIYRIAKSLFDPKKKK